MSASIFDASTALLAVFATSAAVPSSLDFVTRPTAQRSAPTSAPPIVAMAESNSVSCASVTGYALPLAENFIVPPVSPTTTLSRPLSAPLDSDHIAAPAVARGAAGVKASASSTLAA